MLDRIIRILEILFMTVIILFVLWVGISYIDVLIHNTDINGYSYPKWNFFTMFI
jgi:hypothetical protein